jgi:hypothetical protein
MIRREKIILYVVGFIVLIISYDIISTIFFDYSTYPIQKKNNGLLLIKAKQ